MQRTRNAIAGIAALVVSTTGGSALADFPDGWERDPMNPISTELGGCVLFHDGIYKMWGGLDGFDYATSPDGLVWTEHPASPVLVAGPDWYDEVEIANASVVFVDSLYHMWYSGIAADDDNRISHATSTDGVTWFKDGANPVMNLGSPGALDENELIHPFVLYEDPLYRMWYNGVDAAGEQRILYAISLDGVLWARASQPALEAGSPGDWDDDFLIMMWILPVGNTYHMFYTGAGTSGDIAIGYASSPDGIEWTKWSSSEPVFGPGVPGAWDDLAVVRPVVLDTGAEFRMWYWGGQDFSSFGWGVATASDPTAIAEAGPAGAGVHLAQNQPNPFGPRTTIQYTLPASSRVALRIYDAAGRLVRELIEGRTVGAGPHQVPWNGRDEAGRGVAAGVYFYRLEAGDQCATRRMVLVR